MSHLSNWPMHIDENGDRDIHFIPTPEHSDQSAQAEGLPASRLWAPQEITYEFDATGFFIGEPNRVDPSLLDATNRHNDLDKFSFDLVKLGIEIKELFSIFNWDRRELRELIAFLFSNRDLSKGLRILNDERFVPLNLSERAQMSVFRDSEEDINLLNIELDLPGSIEEKYQKVSEIEEWILDNYEDIFGDIMITYSIK